MKNTLRQWSVINAIFQKKCPSIRRFEYIPPRGGVSYNVDGNSNIQYTFRHFRRSNVQIPEQSLTSGFNKLKKYYELTNSCPANFIKTILCTKYKMNYFIKMDLNTN